MADQTRLEIECTGNGTGGSNPALSVPFHEHTNSRKQGDAGLGAAISWFTSAGLTVSIPLTDSQSYDLVVDWKKQLHRVQVRTVRHKGRSGKFEVNLTVSGGNRTGRVRIKKFDPESCDLLVAVDADRNLLVIPSSEIKSKTRLTLTDELRARYQVPRL